MRLNFILFLIISPVFLFAQNAGDTIVVPTINYSQTYSPNGRDTMILFPDIPGISYEKIIMAYNMRCKEGLVSVPGNTNRGCGEWDYSCNTYIYDSTRVDSVLSFQNSHFITHFNGDTFKYVTSPVYDYFQYLQQNVQLNSILSEDQYAIGTGSLSMGNVLKTDEYSGKSQFIYTASELVNAGLGVGEIDGIIIDAVNSGDAGFFRVRIKHTSENMLYAKAPELEGFTEVYFADFSFSTGENRIQFYQPFVWDGTSNLIIEFSFTNNSASNALLVKGEQIGANTGLYTNNGKHIINDAGYTQVPASPFSGISDEITVSFWCFGNPDFLPSNTTIVYGMDPSGNRQLNIHHPWGNSNIYFDCGYSGGYDRIDKAASPEEYKGQWNHWAFTKNASTGDMKIYLNGILWHSGTGKTRLIDITELIIGTLDYSNTLYYYGKIDEFRVWDVELDETTIQEWMNVSVDNTHPYYSNLVAYYQFDEGNGTLAYDASVFGEVAEIHDYVMWGKDRGIDLNRNFLPSDERPNMVFLQGEYDLTVTGNIITEQEARIANKVTTYEIIPRWGTMLHDSINLVGDEFVWQSGYEIVYGPDGARVDSFEILPTDTIVITELEYYKRYPGKIQLMSFVTPYGIYLDLGMEGKTWYFDVSDYGPVLRGWRRLTMENGGQRQEDIDIKFLFIVGTPPRDVLDFRQIWQPASSGYQDIMADKKFEVRDVPMHPDGTSYKLRSVITGHGQEGEFIARWHYLDIDEGDHEYEWKVWTECSTIPIYPQGGTWLYDRAGWCPGDPSNIYEYDITEYVMPGQTHAIDYGILTASGSSNYLISNQLVAYDDPNFTLDAAVVGIEQPNASAAYERFNPACSSPVVVIQNAGLTTLTSLKIYFEVQGGTVLTKNWNGNLEFLETEEVVLEIPDYGFWQGPSNIFKVSVSDPNGQIDEYEYNNTYKAAFEDVDLYDINDTPLKIECKTNLQGYQTSYTLTDLEGNVILERDDLENSTLYSDEVTLELGCYRLRIDDSGDNGLYYWHTPNYGTGYFVVKNSSGVIIENFEPEFGRFAVYDFAVVDMTGTKELPGENEVISIYPNPATIEIHVAFQGLEGHKAYLSLYNASMQEIWNEEFSVLDDKDLETINISDLPSGIYYLKIIHGDRSTARKIVKH